jgi:hypothetical protein
MCMSYSSQVFENKPPSEAVSRRRTKNAKENGQFTPVFNGAHVARSLVFCVMFCRSLFVFLTIVLYVLRITASGYLPLVSSNFSFVPLYNTTHINNELCLKHKLYLLLLILVTQERGREQFKGVA